jgi:hypothetical protein
LPITELSRNFIVPMAPSLVDEAPEGDQWLYEIKADGYRAILSVNGTETRAEPLVVRRARLQELVSNWPASPIQFCGHHVGQFRAFFAAADAHGLEGIVSSGWTTHTAAGRPRLGPRRSVLHGRQLCRDRGRAIDRHSGGFHDQICGECDDQTVRAITP